MFRNGKFSIWCDYLQRDFIKSEFKELISKKIVNGATSNPAIFKNAILNSKSYEFDNFLSPKQNYEKLAIFDIKSACTQLLDNYNNGDDGFVSLEIDPNLCDDTTASIDEGTRLFKEINMPNLMIKVPANISGYKVIKTLISNGINVNATLIFSPNQTKECIKAIKDGNKIFKKNHSDLPLPKVVISVFVSRFDKLLDPKLNLKAKFGVYNATYCYHLIEKSNLENVKTLFASTGVKDKSLNPSYYIKELMFANSINTAPLETIKEFVKEKNIALKEPPTLKECEEFIQKVGQKINLDEVYENLLDDGLKQFCYAFDEILKSIKG